jgi:AraC-like DNA-binding protein
MRRRHDLRPGSPALLQLPTWRTLLAPVLANVFDELGIGASLWNDEGEYEEWYPIHTPPGVFSFEYELGAQDERYRYNHRSFVEVCRTRAILLGQHAGLCDFFVPVQDAGGVRAILVVGSFATARPQAADIRERWRHLSGSHGKSGDPAFLSYVTATLAIATLEAPLLATFRSFLGCFANLLAARGSATALASRAARLRTRLAEAHFCADVWSLVQTMVDPRTASSWTLRAKELGPFGLEQLPRHVLVGLLVSRDAAPDPVDELVRRDAYQRAVVSYARKAGRLVSGRVGEHGVVVLVDRPSSGARAYVAALAGRLSLLARQFGFTLHSGTSVGTPRVDLPAQYASALRAAETAVAEGNALLEGDDHKGERAVASSFRLLFGLRQKLARSARERPDQLLLDFDRYAKAVLLHCGYRLESSRGHFEAGIERLVEPLIEAGALHPRSFDELSVALEARSLQAPTASALADAFRACVADIERAVTDPEGAFQDRSVRRALAFVQDHLGEPLALAEVARVARFAPGHFSKLVRKTQGTSFEQYVRRVRVERAKRMLASTRVQIERIGQICGFRDRHYFHRVFKRACGVTPGAYRSAGRE